MAMRRPRGGSRRRGRGRWARPRWCADFAALAPAAGALAFSDVIDEAVFQSSATLESECVVQRILVSGVVTTSTSGLATLGLGLVKRNEFIGPTFGTTQDPNIVDSLTDDDWLFTQDVSCGEEAQGNWGFPTRIYWDVRVKRKLTSTDRISLVLSNAAGGVAVTSTFMIRALLALRL